MDVQGSSCNTDANKETMSKSVAPQMQNKCYFFGRLNLDPLIDMILIPYTSIKSYFIAGMGNFKLLNNGNDSRHGGY